MRTSILLAAMGLVVSGCKPGGFDRLGPYQLEVMVSTSVSSDLFTVLDYDHSSACESLDPSFSVTVNGDPASDVFPGHGSNLLGHACALPSFSFSPPKSFGENTAVEARCEEDVVIVEIDGLGQTLGGYLVLAPGERVHVGQTVQIALEPGFDRMGWPADGSVFVKGSDLEIPIVVMPPSPEGIVEVQLPSELSPGWTYVQFHPRRLAPQITRCDGPPGGCTFPDSSRLMSVFISVGFNVIE